MYTFTELHDAATSGAFMMEGLTDEVRLNDLYSKYACLCGAVELIGEMTYYAAVAWQLSRTEYAARVANQDFPGVFDYEVSSEFGRWYGAALKQGGAPWRDEATAKIEALVHRFWGQS